MSSEDLEQILRDLPARGTLIKDRGYRQVWRFEQNGKAFYLKFYPKGGFRDLSRRLFRGSPAQMEFTRLQWLQKAKIPAPRAVAFLGGFNLQGRKGDAVILAAIEPSISLDQLLNDQSLTGDYPSADRRKLADQVVDLVHQLGAAGFGHGDLHLGNFLLHEGRLFLIDAYEVRKGGLTTRDIMLLGASVTRFATTTDLLRGWRKLAWDAPMPQHNPRSAENWQNAMTRVMGNNRYFGTLAWQDWAGVFFRMTKYPRRWSAVSRLDIPADDWAAALPRLVESLEAGTLEMLKESKSGGVYRATVRLAGQDVQVILKRPQRRYWYRYLNEIGRGARARRAWKKAWHLVNRDLPTAWPIAFFERRRLGYVTDTFMVTEYIPGPTLWTLDLDALTTRSRDMVFRRAGRILRALEQFGFSHFDAKASNWIIRADERLGPGPVLIDVDGIRYRRWITLGIRRLLKSLTTRRQYGPADSLSLCKGYAPYARLDMEAMETEPATPGEAEKASDDLA